MKQITTPQTDGATAITFASITKSPTGGGAGTDADKNSTLVVFAGKKEVLNKPLSEIVRAANLFEAHEAVCDVAERLSELFRIGLPLNSETVLKEREALTLAIKQLHQAKGEK